MAAGEYANMAKYAAGEVACNSTHAAVHTPGGSVLTTQLGLTNMMVAARLGRIAPVSREMILNFVAMRSMGLPKSCWRTSRNRTVGRSGQGCSRAVRWPRLRLGLLWLEEAVANC